MNEVEQLIQRYLDAAMTAEDRRRLSELVERDPSVRQQLREAAKVHGLLLELADARAAQTSAGIENIVEFPGGPAAAVPARRRHAWPGIVAVAIAACVVLGVAVFWPARDGRPADAVARITTDTEIGWSGSGQPDRKGWMGRGAYEIRSGVARLHTDGGAIVSIAAPAQFELLGADVLKLQSGKLLARMLGKGSRLTVLTNGMNVVDRGTAFGINTSDAGPSLLSVLEGTVELHTKYPRPSSEVVTAGNSMMVGHGGEGDTVTRVSFDRSTFGDLWPLTLGVDAVSSLVRFLPPGPYDDPMAEFKSDNHLFIMPERQGVMLTKPLPIQAWRSSRELEMNQFTVGEVSGRRVDSYLLFFNPANASIAHPVSLSGEITFNRRIIGLIFYDKILYQSDAQLGVPGLNYATEGRRGLEIYPGDQPGQDIFEVSPDGRRLFFNFHVSFERDQLRVVLASEL